MGDTVSISLSTAPTHRPGVVFIADDTDDAATQHGDNEEQAIGLPAGLVIGENYAPAFGKTDLAALDFFNRCIPGIQVPALLSLLDMAWTEDPQTALQLIFQTGNVRNGGKMDRNNFYHCIMWLWNKHPTTLILNVGAIAEHTCLKDALQVLVFALHGRSSDDPLCLDAYICDEYLALDHKRGRSQKKPIDKTRKRAKRTESRLALKEAFALTLNKSLKELLICDGTEPFEAGPNESSMTLRKVKRVEWISAAVTTQWDDFVKEADAVVVLAAKADKQRRLDAMKVDGDPCSTFTQELFDAVVDIFVQGLAQELETLRTKPTALSGIYAKWAPSVGGMHDKAVPMLVNAIAEKVLVRELYDTAWDTLSEEDTISARRVAYSGKVLSKLRGAAKIPEHFVGNKKFHEVDYNKMPSRCRLLFGKTVFAKHDMVRYSEFLEDAQALAVAKKSDAFARGPTVKVGVLLPHEVTEQAAKTFRHVTNLRTMALSNEAVHAEHLKTAEMLNMQVNVQWDELVSVIKTAMANGTGVGRVIPVVDVSGSMDGIPMEVATALGLLLAGANTVESGWHGKMITFHSEPALVTIQTPADSLDSDNNAKLPDIGELWQRTRAMDWAGRTNMVKTMELFIANSLLAETPAAEVAASTLVVFSDMVCDPKPGTNCDSNTIDLNAI